jgi:hypothetical protein
LERRQVIVGVSRRGRRIGLLLRSEAEAASNAVKTTVRQRLTFVYRQLWNWRRDRHSAAGGRDRRTAEAAPVRAYQRSDEGQPATVVTALHDARKRVRPLLAEAVP